jgi:NitT/TauT family transport system permease protein
MRRLLPSVVLVLALAALWQLLYWLLGATAWASPVATVVRLEQLLRTPSFGFDVLETFRAFAYALVLALAGGIALGIILGVHRLSGAVAEPILVTLYSIPKVTLYPLVLLCFGLGLWAKVAFGVMHGLVPITIFTMNAIRQMKPVYLTSARALRLTSLQTATTVVLPAILPEVISGAQLGFSLTLLGVLIGEMFASQRGLGFVAMNAIGVGNIETIMAVALLLTVFAVSCNAALLALGRRLRG